jgi:hypothetical protein
MSVGTYGDIGNTCVARRRDRLFPVMIQIKTERDGFDRKFGTFYMPEHEWRTSFKEHIGPGERS